MNIRLAGAADNDALVALARSLSLPGLVRIGADRAPDFFALDRMIGGTPRTMVVEDSGRIVGFLDACDLPVRVGERIVPGAQLSLAGMLPDYRRKGLFRSIQREMERHLRALDMKLALGVNNSHNARMRELVETWPHGAIIGEHLRLHLLFADALPRRASRWSVRTAVAMDMPRIDTLVTAHRQAYDVAPVLPPGGVAGYAGLGPSDFHVACDTDGRIVACLALWDQQAWRRTPVLAYGTTMGALRFASDRLCAIARRPRLPAIGAPFRFCHIAFPAAERGAEAAFAVLLHAAARALRERQLHFLALGLPDSDPLGSALAGFVRFAMVAVPFITPADEETASPMRRRSPPRVWLDYALT